MRPYLCSPFASRLLRTRSLRTRTVRAFCFSLSALLLMFSLLAPALPVQAESAVTDLATPDLGAPSGPQAPVFVPNGGQTDSRVRFESYALGGTVFFTPQEVVLALPDAPVAQAKASILNSAAATAAPEAQERTSRSMQVARVKFEGANSGVTISAEDQVAGVLNIIQGTDPAKWQLGLKNYGSIIYNDLYSGVSLRYQGQASALKGTYEVTAGADPSQIRWSYQGATNVQVDPTSGDLKISLVSGKGQLVEHAPQAWQEIDGKRVPVSASYAVSGSKGSTTVGFNLGSYNKALPLTIDPTLEYSTYLGGIGADRISAMSINASGDVFVTGETYTVKFPGTSGSLAENSYPNAFAAAMDANGTMIYRTIFGGDNTDQPTGIVANGDVAHLVGYTASANFPKTTGIFRGGDDMFVLSLDKDGKISYGTLLGGPGQDQATGVALQGNLLYLTGYTDMIMLGCTPVDCSLNGGMDVVLAQINLAGGPTVGFIKQYGGSFKDLARAIAIDSVTGAVYLTGNTKSDGSYSTNIFPGTSQPDFGGIEDAFLMKLDSSGVLQKSLFLGGADTDEAYALTIDSSGGQVYLTGRTLSDSATFTELSGSKSTGSEAFFLKVSTSTWTPTGVYLGGNGQDQGNAIALANDGTIYVTGTTSSTNFLALNPLEQMTVEGQGGLNDAFLIRYTPAFTPVYSTKLGGSGDDYGQALALDQRSADIDIYVAGYTNSGNFPMASASQGSLGGVDDGFIARIGNSRPVVDLNGADADIDNSASFVEQGDTTGSGPVSLGASAIVKDDDNATLAYLEARFVAASDPAGAAVQPPDRTAESLNVTLAGGMTGSYNPTTGVLRLTAGTSTTKADFQSALQSLTYNNTSDTPTTTDRLVAVEASDGMNTNEPLAYVTISVQDTNDSPVLTTPANPITGLKEDLNNPLSGFSISDVDAGVTNAVILTFSVPGAQGTLSTTSTDTSLFTGNGGSTLVFTGTLSALNNLLLNNPVIFTGAKDFNGTATLTVTLNDQGYTSSASTPGTDQAELSLVVDPINDKPTFVASDALIVDEDSDYISQPWADPANFYKGADNEIAQTFDKFDVTVTENAGMFVTPPHVDVSTGNLSFDLVDNANGTAKFAVKLHDMGGTTDGGVDYSDPLTVTLTVEPINDAPVVPTTVPLLTMLEDAAPQTVNIITGLGITDSNDTTSPPAAAGAVWQVKTLAPVAGKEPTLGSVTFDPNGPSLTYTPKANEFGSDTFTYQVCDTGTDKDASVSACSDQQVNVSITPVNDKPSFTVNSTSITVSEEQVYGAQAWLASFNPGAANENGQIVDHFVVSNISNASLFAAGGSPSIDPSGKMSFVLAKDANGSTTFDVQLVDKGGTANGGVDLSDATTVTLTVNPVNDVPVTTIAAPTLTVIEDTPRAVSIITDLGFNDDADINPPAYNPSTKNYGFPPLGSITVGGVTKGTISNMNLAGTFTYEPNPNAVGTNTLWVQVCDNGDPGYACSATQTVTVNITPVNDKPTFNPPAASLTLSVNEDETTYNTGAAWVDPAAPGVFVRGPIDEASQMVDSFVVSNITNTGLFTTGPSVDKSGNLSFVLTPNANGSTQFDVQVVDSGGTDLGGINTSNPVTVTLTVNPVNDEPVMPADKSISLTEGVATKFWITDPILGVSDELDTAFGGTALLPLPSGVGLAPVVTTPPQHGAVTFTNLNTGEFTFTPVANYNGTDIFTYKICDNGTPGNVCASQTVSVTITGINDPPTFTAGDSVITVDEDSSNTGTDNTYNAPWATEISAGPNENQTLSFEVGMSQQYEALFTTQPAVNATTGNLSFVLAPNANTNGISIPLNIQLKDNGSTVPPNQNYSNLIATVHLTINAVNDPPVMPDTALAVTEDQVKTANITSLNVTDGFDTAFGGADLLPLKTEPTFTIAPQHGKVTFLTKTVGTDTVYTGEFTYAPAANYNEGDTFTYEICDNGKPGSACNTQKVTVNFTPVNDPPSFTAGAPNISVNEDGNSTGSPANTYDIGWADPATFNKGALNESSQTLSFEVGMSQQYNALFTTQPAVDATTGNLKFVLAPNANTNGASIPLNIQLKDNGSSISPNQNYSNLVATINLTINAVNDPPTFSTISTTGTVTVNENSGAYDQPWANPASFSVGPGNESTQALLGFTVTANDNTGLFMPGYAPMVTSDGRLQFMPMTGVFGTAHLTVTLKDNGGIAFSGNDSYDLPLTINVTSINDLSLSVTPDATGTILPGYGTTFTLTATNPEVTPADNLKFTTTLPALLLFDSATSPDCTAAGQVVTCTVTSVAAGNSASVTLGVLVSSGLAANQAIPFTVSLSALQHDPDMNNNQADGVVNAVLKKAFYFNDFETKAGSEWSDQTRSQTPLQKRNFLGEFNNQSITLTFDTIEDHGQVEVDFDLFILRSWDGNQTSNQALTNSLVPDIAQTDQVRGPDLWEFIADGTNLIHSTFTNWDPMRQSYPGRYLADNRCGTDAAEQKTLGYSYGYFENLDSVYHIHKVFNHTDSTLTLTFQDLGLQGMLPEGYYDESWGLDNVKVQLLGKPMPNTIYLPMVTKR